MIALPDERMALGDVELFIQDIGVYAGERKLA